MRLWLWMLLCGLAFGQVPQNVTGTVSRSTQLATIKWNAVPGATSYSVYKTPTVTYTTCPASTAQSWVEVQGITVTEYADPGQITNPPIWCYAVTAHFGGTESAFSVPVDVATESGYTAFFYVNTCAAGAVADEAATAGSTAVFTQYRNGVATVLPVQVGKTIGVVGWHYHLFDDANYTMKLIWNDGTVEGPFPVFESRIIPKSSIAVEPIHVSKIKGIGGAICSYDEIIREQKTTP